MIMRQKTYSRVFIFVLLLRVVRECVRVYNRY